MRALLSSLFGLFVLSSVGHALGAPAASTAPNPAEADGEPDRPYVPAAPDLLAGHLSLGVSPGLATIFGGFGERLPAHDLRVGYGANVDAAYGIARDVAVGVWGQYLSHGGASACPACSARTYAIGPFVRYHVVQGTRFDPWILLGIDYRTARATRGTTTTDLSGVEWLRLGLGGDYYATSNLSLGPWVELELGHLFASGSSTGTIRASLVMGISIGFDTPGK